ncbi:glutamine amidotransferase-related protein [Vibrio sp. B1FLJ16]|uniref:glutamine amidotransferase-related protein n=1 Tax=Vibrio sp. B1FLJ16 TaxID=2751178 RepID=UPI0015F5C1E6|nr:type 1 glutamine amidotransferase [Vibrio sp. B1FLJ16]CAD7802533.1 Glutamine amidotransferase class-I [Vibrio sp. B1FLJ16]CAE6893697.1 Glutamine amidotransferase class-I [Vibrio sp. B1FLJ16]
MKIGIITCGYVDPPLSDNHGQYADMIETAFASVNEAMVFQNYDAIKGELPGLDECHGFILTGSVHNAYDDLPWILALVDWIRSCEARKKPLVGICFGHQIIARALGGVVEKSHKGWGLGSYEVKIVALKKWMNLAIDNARMLVSHQDQVVVVPSEMSVIAGNDFCPNFMLVKDNHILTVQGHPEFSSEFTEKLVKKRQHLLSEHQYEDAFIQLQKPNDSVLFLHWMDAFFTRDQQRISSEVLQKAEL